jgi:hypothetical protein
MIGSREPAKLDAWRRAAGPYANVGTLAETAQFGDLVVLSVIGTAAEEVIRLAGVDNLAGKIVLDASDPLDFSSGRPGLFVGTTDSLGERIQGRWPLPPSFWRIWPEHDPDRHAAAARGSIPFVAGTAHSSASTEHQHASLGAYQRLTMPEPVVSP